MSRVPKPPQMSTRTVPLAPDASQFCLHVPRKANIRVNGRQLGRIDTTTFCLLGDSSGTRSATHPGTLFRTPLRLFGPLHIIVAAPGKTIAWHVHQKPSPQDSHVHTPGGLPVYFVSPRKTRPVSLEPAALDALDAAHHTMAALWGDAGATAMHSVVMSSAPSALNNGTIADPYLSTGTVILGAQASSAEYRNAAIHEAGHNLRESMQRERPASAPAWAALDRTAKQLVQQDGLAIDFFREAFLHNNPDAGGHPHDNGHELFASMTSALAQSPDLWRTALQRLDQVHRTPDACRAMRAQIGVLLDRYEALLHHAVSPAHAANVLRPYRDALQTTPIHPGTPPVVELDALVLTAQQR